MRSQVQPSSKNFSKAEFQLVKDSSAKSVKSFTPARLHSRISKIEKLLKNYKTKMKAQRKTRRSEVSGDKLEGRKLIDYRMEHLNKSLGSYRDQLKTVEASSEKSSTRSPRKSAKTSTRRAATSRTGVAKTGRKASAAKKSASTRQTAKTSGSRKATSSKPALRARKSTSDRIDKTEESQDSKGMLPQHKMRLNRKGNGARFRESQRQQSLQETEVNPARRNI